MNSQQKMFSSLHTHSLFCDGRDDIETMCRIAYEKKLYAIGFSAHAPLDKQLGKKTGWHLPQERLDEYVSEVQAAKSRWQGKIEVFLGLEVDYIKGLRSPLDSDIKAINADYLIGSVHYVIPPNGEEIFTVDGPPEEFIKGFNKGFGSDGEALMHCYYDMMAEMTVLGGFNILGHADLLKKNCENKKFWKKECELSRQKEIARIVAGSVNADIAANIAVEVNTGGLNREKINDTYPSEEFLHFFNECKVPAIITADAHNAHDIDGNYEFAIKTLLNAGFSEHVLFFTKNNGKILLHKEKIHH